MQKKRFVLGIVLFLLLVNVVSSTEKKGSDYPPSFCGEILYVGGTGPGNYSKIQDALDNTTDGDMVFVYNGTYYENIIITNSIVLQGEEKYSTIIDGCGRNDTVTLLGTQATVTGFTITNSSTDIVLGWWKAGIRVLGSNNCIQGNIIRDNRLGIFGKQVSNLTIQQNIFQNDSLTFYPYDTGYLRRPVLLKEYFIHTIEDNIVNGKPLLYYCDQKDFDVPSSAGQVIAVNCTNMRIRNMSLSHADFMVMLVLCSECVIEYSTFTGCDGACSLLASDENIIRNNYLSQNFHGLLLDYYSSDNQISQNQVIDNEFCGVICEYFSNHNDIFQNTFINNGFRNGFFIKAFRNTWDNNYWSDWIGVERPVFRFVPKVIGGQLFERVYLPSWVNVDWHPVSDPYELV